MAVTLGTEIRELLHRSSGRWGVTGAAGFIGSHLVEALLSADQEVVALDNFATGSRRNLERVRESVGAARWSRCEFIEGDITDREGARRVCSGVSYILHQAALGSVPRSIAEPLASHEANVTGFVTMLVAAQECGVDRFVYASSSSVYGDSTASPKREGDEGQVLSPYAATKAIDEVYGGVFARCYQQSLIGLRYFNVFGPRQDPNGPYAAVIPRWTDALFRGNPVVMYGDGSTTRDFCYIANVVEANLRAALMPRPAGQHEVFNIACGESTSLLQLFGLLREAVGEVRGSPLTVEARHEPFRAGDVAHSLADISRARKELGYEGRISVREGILETVKWFGRDSGC